MKSFYSPLFALLTLVCVMVSCGHEPDAPATERTVLVYMVANNSLSANSFDDIAEMKRAAADIKGHLIVYHHPYNGEPRLFEIERDGSERQLASYTTEESSVSIARMRRVLSDTKALAPSDSYGLVLWSHANGWHNDKGVIDEPEPQAGISPLSFGEDGIFNPKKMKLSSLARALEGNSFDFIYFDCCHMATVEVAYELRHLTPWIVASVTELELDGMPYDRNLRHLFASTPRLEAAMAETYNALTQPGMYGCSISLIATAGLDGLAEASREALQKELPQDYTPVPCFRTLVMRTGIFDMHHYFNSLTATDPALATRWNNAFRNTVKATLSSERVYTLVTDNFHGLGCNIVSDTYPASYNGYDQTAWWADVMKENKK